MEITESFQIIQSLLKKYEVEEITFNLNGSFKVKFIDETKDYQKYEIMKLLEDIDIKFNANYDPNEQ